jgi:CRP-like cAMP-binding protein
MCLRHNFKPFNGEILGRFYMKDIISKLEKNEFFQDLSYDEIKQSISNIGYFLKAYNKGEIIANEEEECNSLGFVLDGIIEIQRIYLSGKQIILKRLSDGDVFGEALIFSKESKYPSTVVAFNKCNILYISKADILRLCTMDQRILGNFMSTLSNKILMLNSKIKSIAFKSIKHKVINFILQQAKMERSEIIKLKQSKEEIAAELGIPRPSLSRELINLRDLKYIEFDRSIIKILKVEELEEELFD